jgi:CRP-like cAMP-binding protein
VIVHGVLRHRTRRQSRRGQYGRGDGPHRSPPPQRHAIAETDLELAVFDTNSFRTLLDEMPRASEKVLGLLNERLRRASS